VFDVVDHFEEILDAFRSDEEDPHPAKWKHAGELTIEPKDPANLPMKIQWFDYGSRTFRFKVGETYYVGGSPQQLMQLLDKRTPIKAGSLIGPL
jgi:hypothetical protein